MPYSWRTQKGVLLLNLQGGLYRGEHDQPRVDVDEQPQSPVIENNSHCSRIQLHRTAELY